MDCSACGKTNQQDAELCVDCGKPLAERCGACGSVLPTGARFCHQCGARQQGVLGLGDDPAAQSPSPNPQPRTANPLSYTPKHLAERILRSRSAIEGERKQVTVLFADVQGSMELAEQVDAEEWHRIMDGFFAILSDGVHRFEGTINQYTGDGIMALFGAPIALEDHASRACYSALRLTDELRRYAQALKRDRGLRFSVRMGLNSGNVVVGKIGDDLRMDYTAQGATVGLAARMEQLADPGKVYLTEHTEALVRGFFELEDLGTFRIKGVREPVRTFVLNGLGPLRSRLEVSQARGFSPFLGREDAIARLESALQSALAGSSQVVRIVAEAGVGKSRLCYEFAQSCRARGVEVHEASAVSHGRNISLLPVLQLYRSLFGVASNDSDEVARRKIAGTLVLLDDDLKELLPVVFELLGVPDPRQPTVAPETKRQQLFDLAVRVVVSRSQSQPVVILLEDLHWFDEGSEAFLQYLLKEVREARVLFLLNHRPQYDADLLASRAGPPLILQPFGPKTTEKFLRKVLGDDTSLDPLYGRLHEHAGGNPFFVEEVVSELEQSGKLAGIRGGYRLTEPIEDVILPTTVHAILAARMDRLPESGKRVLQTAAVIGRSFTERVLGKVMVVVDGVVSPAEVSNVLRELRDADFLFQSESLPVEYMFKHPLTQEVAYQTQLNDRRRQVHAATAIAIIEIGEKLDELAALLAHHWEMAERFWESAVWNRRAADWAAGTDNVGALRHLRKALELLERAPATEEAARLSVDTREALLRLGPFVNLPGDEAEVIFAVGRKVAEELGGGSLLVRLVSTYGYFCTMAGEIEQAHGYAQEAASLAETFGNHDAKARVSLDEAQTAIWSGRLRDALATAEASLSAYRRGDALYSGLAVGLGGEAFLLALRGVCLSLMGRAREGALDLESAVAGAQREGQREGLLVAHFFGAVGTSAAGDLEAGLPHARRALQLALELKHPFFEPVTLALIGSAQVFAGQWREGRGVLEDLLERDVGPIGLLAEPLVHNGLAIAYAEAGEFASAKDAATKALDLATARGVKVAECLALLGVARVTLKAEGAPACSAVRSALDRAAALVEETGARTFEPRIHIERAALALALDDEQTRKSEIERALRLGDEMGVRPYAPELELPLDR